MTSRLVPATIEGKRGETNGKVRELNACDSSRRGFSKELSGFVRRGTYPGKKTPRPKTRRSRPPKRRYEPHVWATNER